MLLVEIFGNEIHCIVNVLNLQCPVLVHFYIEFFLESCDQLHTLHGICSQVKNKIGIVGDLRTVYFQDAAHHFLDSFEYFIFFHCGEFYGMDVGMSDKLEPNNI